MKSETDMGTNNDTDTDTDTDSDTDRLKINTILCLFMYDVIISKINQINSKLGQTQFVIICYIYEINMLPLKIKMFVANQEIVHNKLFEISFTYYMLTFIS